MYFWNINELSIKLKHNVLSPSETFKYFCVSFAILGKFVLFSAYVSGYDSQEALIDTTISLIVTLIGLIICFKINKKGDNQQFLTRFFCLSIPITVRLFLIMVIFLATNYLLFIWLQTIFSIQQLKPIYTLINAGAGIMLDVIYYAYMAKYLALISKKHL